MWSILALGSAEVLLNRIIDLDAITRLKLNELTGQMLRVVIDAPNMTVDVYFDQDKVRLESAALGQAQAPSVFEQRPFDVQSTVQKATATLHVKDLVTLFKLLITPQDQLGTVPLQGDYHLLFALKQIMAQTELDLASSLSPWVGASFAHEIGKLQNIPKHAVRGFSSAEFMLSDTIKEDLNIFASRWQMDELQQQTRQFQQDLDRTEAKLQQLAQHFSFKD